MGKIFCVQLQRYHLKFHKLSYPYVEICVARMHFMIIETILTYNILGISAWWWWWWWLRRRRWQEYSYDCVKLIIVWLLIKINDSSGDLVTSRRREIGSSMRKSKDYVHGIWVYKVLGIWKGYYRVKKSLVSHMKPWTEARNSNEYMKSHSKLTYQLSF